ncbi:Rho GTPase activating protein [Fusarium falciforme]
MSRLALQSAQASASASAPASDSVDVATTTPVETTTPAFGFDHHHNLNRAASPSDVPVDDSPTVGRIIHSNPAVPSLGSLSSSGPRSPRPAISSPLATSLNFPFGPTSPSPRSISFPLRQTPTPTSLAEQAAKKTAIVRQTSFYSDSSDEGSPEPRSPRLGYPGSPNELRTVSDPVTLKPSQGSISNPRPAMAGPVAATQAESSKSMPRNSSIDSAISAISIKSGPNGNQDGQHGADDIANLIKTAGSPEALIQYLLKEKHSQSQQNGQLWRLVDKQRAMILGLNKDLERALKDKEKYRKKLKEVMSIPAVSQTPSGTGKAPAQPPRTSAPRVDIERTKEQAVTPDSPTLESDSPKNSPIDISMAPYPITPPADQPSAPHSAVGELLNPAHSMPKPQDHALDKFDHEAEERAADQARKEKSEEPLKDIAFNISIPPSRSLPSEPPKMPPPKPPTGHLPTVSILEATPRTDEGFSQFPAPPPRKPPPAPLQLIQDKRPKLSPSPEDEETDSDYDDILEVDEIVDDRRGRRRTREEDDREREIIALKEAAARSASKKSKSSQPGSPRDVPPTSQSESETASLAQMLNAPKAREIPAPLLSPGLPASPRPFNMSSPPLSPRTAPFQAAPLSPRPPRAPIPLPPNTPLATPGATPARTPATAPITEDPTSPKKQPAQEESIGYADKPATRMSSPTERTEVYKGLVTEEYPDLLLPPNALPSVEVKVASSRMKPSRASMLSLTQLEEDPVFTLAVISRADNGELWRVEKDSASLTKLDQRLKQFSSYKARMPERSLFSGHAPAKLDARRAILEQFMDDLLNTPFDTNTAVEVCKYLSTNVLPPNSDDTGSIGDSGSEVSGSKTGADGRPRRSGYLTKKGKNFGGWKARFFVLDGPHLKYYEVPGGAHLGTIKLQGAQIGKQSQSNDNQSPARGATGEDLDNQFRHAFLILEPKKKDLSSHVKHVLCAESDRERDRWVESLLQWIDYRDPDDSEPPPSRSGPIHDRQTSLGERAGGNKVRKGPHKPHHHPSDSDTLIGVRYGDTQAGDAPQLAAPATPARPKTSGGLPDHHHHHGFDSLSSQTSKLISGPKDPQPISDAGAWGNKTGLSLPTNDEKKQRKRSFFGFGPKTRSSSEGQDSLFGGSEGGSNATPPQNAYQGPVRQAFGAPLAEAVRYNSPTDVNVPVPAVVYRCIQYLDAKDAVLEEGIFRLSGSNVVIKQLRERFNTEGDVNLVTDPQYYDIHAVASLLKLYLRELPTTILTRELHMEFLSTIEIPDHTKKIAAMNELVQRLPQANATLLKYLIGFLIKIINNADMNKMTVRNVGIVFSPTLNIPAPVFAMFLQNYEGIFGIDPEVYELPSPISEPDLHAGGFPDAPPRFELPTRPSTSGGASPHGQMRKDSIQNLKRSTPTPPLLMNNPAVRASPPSSASRPGFDPSNHYDSRPLYDGGYRPPSGHDTRGGYDRRIYQASHEDLGSASAAYDQSFVPNRRRESAIFMGGIVGPHHQGSKSRLREETRF